MAAPARCPRRYPHSAPETEAATDGEYICKKESLAITRNPGSPVTISAPALYGAAYSTPDGSRCPGVGYEHRSQSSLIQCIWQGYWATRRSTTLRCSTTLRRKKLWGGGLPGWGSSVTKNASCRGRHHWNLSSKMLVCERSANG